MEQSNRPSALRTPLLRVNDHRSWQSLVRPGDRAAERARGRLVEQTSPKQIAISSGLRTSRTKWRLLRFEKPPAGLERDLLEGGPISPGRGRVKRRRRRRIPGNRSACTRIVGLGPQMGHLGFLCTFISRKVISRSVCAERRACRIKGLPTPRISFTVSVAWTTPIKLEQKISQRTPPSARDWEQGPAARSADKG